LTPPTYVNLNNQIDNEKERKKERKKEKKKESKTSKHKKQNNCAKVDPYRYRNISINITICFTAISFTIFCNIIIFSH